MKYILFPEGRILNNNGAFEYEYHLKDHLGSVRVAFVPTVNGKEVVQENAYYPFGATIADLSYAAPLNNNRYGYTGQEQLNDFDLNWYDYIARNYNPLIGRFNSIDPLAEKYYSISPYAYCNNNPVRFVDPDGREIRISFRTGFLGLGGKESLRYESGVLYNEDGSVSEHQSKQRGFLKKTVNALNSIGSTSNGGAMLSELEASSNIFTIQHANDNPREPGANEFVTDNRNAAYAIGLLDKKQGRPQAGGSGGVIYWNPNSGSVTELGGNLGFRSTSNLAHELFHGYDANFGLLDNRIVDGLKRDEWRASYFENQVRNQLGYPYRMLYNTRNGPVRILDSTNQPIPMAAPYITWLPFIYLR